MPARPATPTSLAVTAAQVTPQLSRLITAADAIMVTIIGALLRRPREPPAGRRRVRVRRMATKLSLVVRTDLGMGRGKLAAQVAHAAVAAVLTAQLTAEGRAGLAAWLAGGQPKVVLSVGSDAELADIAAAASAAGLPTEVIRDAGRTQLAPGTTTCCAIGPADAARVDAVTGGLSLL